MHDHAQKSSGSDGSPDSELSPSLQTCSSPKMEKAASRRSRRPHKGGGRGRGRDRGTGGVGDRGRGVANLMSVEAPELVRLVSAWAGANTGSAPGQSPATRTPPRASVRAPGPRRSTRPSRGTERARPRHGRFKVSGPSSQRNSRTESSLERKHGRIRH